MATDQDQFLGLSALHIACLEGDNVSIRRLLVQENFNKNGPTTAGDTPIMLAAIMGHHKTIRFLLNMNADLNIRNKSGFTFYDILTNSKHANEQKQKYRGADMGQQPSNSSEKKTTVQGLFVLREGGDFQILESRGINQTGYSLTDKKVLGVLRNGQNMKYAWSGYDPKIVKTKSRSAKVLDSKTWCRVARKVMAPSMGFKFERNWNDDGNRTAEVEDQGRNLSSHVEVLLSTWYVLFRGMKAVSKRATIKQLIAFWRREAKLGKKRCLELYITKDPCAPCSRWLAAISRHTGVQFEIKMLPRVSVLPPSKQERFQQSEGEEDAPYRGTKDSHGEEEEEEASLPAPSRKEKEMPPAELSTPDNKFKGNIRASQQRFQMPIPIANTPAVRLK